MARRRKRKQTSVNAGRKRKQQEAIQDDGEESQQITNQDDPSTGVKEEPTDSEQSPPPTRRSKRTPKQRVIPDSTSLTEDLEMFDDEVQDRNFVIEVEEEISPSNRQRSQTEKPAKNVKQRVVSIPCPAENGLRPDTNESPMIAGDHFRQHICAPRSEENEKYKEVYATIPDLRSVSPPRFSTKGVVKKKIDCEELGVKKLGKTKGNPYSKFHTRRNGVVFGNQTLETAEEEQKFTAVATNIKNVLRSQTTTVRLSSYVQPELLKKAREKNVKTTRRIRPKVHEEGDVDIDVDIETIDDSYLNLEPETEEVKPKRKISNRGRKPGKTILECEECGYKTTHSGHMKIHIVCVHKDIKMLECQYAGCDYKCARKGSMTRHEKCVHRKDQVFKCQQCDFQSAWSISLERHIITRHEKLKPWTCKICNQSFGQQFTLTQHVNTVHKKLKRVLCAFCNFRASTKVSVRSHILRKHKDEIEQAINESDEEQEQES